MQHKLCFEVVDRLLKDLRDPDHLFGGVPILLGGDFAQILPVMKSGSRADVVAACLQRSYFWPHLSILRLRQSRRLHRNAANNEFSEWLQRLPYDPQLNGTTQIPDYIRSVTTLDDLIDKIFDNAEFLSERAILTVRNDKLQSINDTVLERMPTQTFVFYAQNTATNDTIAENDGDFYAATPEYMQELDLPGLPPSLLKLKVGAPVMLMRNLRPKVGLCNGTRLIITAIHRHLIRAKILNGTFAGQVHLIPRIQLSSNDNLHFTLNRHQYPIKLCFRMTINKSQGQTLGATGIDLRTPVFSHGQLYVALSRIVDVSNLTILSPTRQVKNIVFREVLDIFER